MDEWQANILSDFLEAHIEAFKLYLEQYGGAHPDEADEIIDVIKTEHEIIG